MLCNNRRILSLGKSVSPMQVLDRRVVSDFVLLREKVLHYFGRYILIRGNLLGSPTVEKSLSTRKLTSTLRNSSKLVSQLSDCIRDKNWRPS